MELQPWFQSRVVATICVRFAWYLYPWTETQSRTQSNEGNPRFMGQGFKEITLWDKTLTVTLVWRWFEERFRGRYRNAKATAVDLINYWK
jgi:hypothetical protein